MLEAETGANPELALDNFYPLVRQLDLDSVDYNNSNSDH